MHNLERRRFKVRRQMLIYDNSTENEEDQRQREDRRVTRSGKDSR